MTFIIIGFIVGIIMGLTGAGGALISIPLFIHLLQFSLKDATVLSLLTIIISTAINLFNQFSKIDFKIALAISITGIFSNYLLLPLKQNTSDLLIAFMLLIVVLFSLWSIWNKNQKTNLQEKPNNLLPKAIVTGFIIGFLTAFTGLGGGVVLVPVLLQFFGKSYKNALATSLSIILIISCSSFYFQITKAQDMINPTNVFYLFIGTITSFFVLSNITQKVENNKLDLIRKTAFSLVAIYSVATVIIKLGQ